VVPKVVGSSPIRHPKNIYNHMPHIHTEPGQHDATASAFIIRLDFKEPKLMLHIHKKLGVYMQFGGHIELHETPWQTVIHELEEESGYTIDQLKILQPKIRLKDFKDAKVHPMPIYYQTHLFPTDFEHYHTDAAFAFITKEQPKMKVAAGESENIQLFTAEELRAIPANQIPENVRITGLFALEKCLQEYEAVDTAQYN
jgi:8-oxo-dGTP pyrophosphatase MutT (NUDIX family)